MPFSDPPGPGESWRSQSFGAFGGWNGESGPFGEAEEVLGCLCRRGGSSRDGESDERDGSEGLHVV